MDRPIRLVHPARARSYSPHGYTNRIGSSFGNEGFSPHFRVFSGPTILAVSPNYVANLVEIPLGGTRENEMGDEVDDEARDKVPKNSYRRATIQTLS